MDGLIQMVLNALKEKFPDPKPDFFITPEQLCEVLVELGFQDMTNKDFPDSFGTN